MAIINTMVFSNRRSHRGCSLSKGHMYQDQCWRVKQAEKQGGSQVSALHNGVLFPPRSSLLGMLLEQWTHFLALPPLLQTHLRPPNHVHRLNSWPESSSKTQVLIHEPVGAARLCKRAHLFPVSSVSDSGGNGKDLEYF